MPNTSRTHRAIKLTAAIAVITVITATVALTGSPAQQADTDPVPAAVATPAANLGTSALEGEVWWTTTDCPAGVAIPCLDPTADPNRVPPLVADALEELVEAQWVCLDVVGTPMADGTVRVEHAQLLQCRTFAYLATDPTRVRLGEDSEGPAYDCRLDGNRVCGGSNDQGVPAGDYGSVQV